MSAILDRLLYLSEQHTQTWISQETGIPQSTLSYVLSGKRDLPSYYSISVTNAYAREVYYELRSYGVTPNEARTYRYSSPSVVGELLNQIETKLSTLALGHMSRFYPEIYANREGEDFDKMLNRQIQDIIMGMEYNRTSMKEFMDYPG